MVNISNFRSGGPGLGSCCCAVFVLYKNLCFNLSRFSPIKVYKGILVMILCDPVFNLIC